MLVLIILIICLILQFLLLQPPGCTQDSDCQMPGKNGKYSSHPINLKLVQIIFKFCEVMKNGQILTHWMNILRGRISAFVNLNNQDFSGDCRPKFVSWFEPILTSETGFRQDIRIFVQLHSVNNTYFKNLLINSI